MFRAVLRGVDLLEGFITSWCSERFEGCRAARGFYYKSGVGALLGLETKSGPEPLLFILLRL